MALDDFWRNVRTAARLIAPNNIIDSPPLDEKTIEERLRSEPSWLNQSSVAGFDEEDFGFLEEPQRTRLKELVEQFRGIAPRATRRPVLEADLVSRALPLFRGIVDTLEFNRYADAEAYRLGKLIENDIKADWPEGLAQLRFRTGLDHSGEPVLKYWVFLNDDASATEDRFLDSARKLDAFLQPIARAIAPDRWPYPSFRSLKEETEPVEAS